MEIDADVISSESPVSMVILALSAIVPPQSAEVLPVDSSQPVMYSSVSGLVPAHEDHVGVLVIAISELAELPQVSASRVVTDDTAVVPAAPGSAVWSCA
jgi:hypothetical protein